MIRPTLLAFTLIGIAAAPVAAAGFGFGTAAAGHRLLEDAPAPAPTPAPDLALPDPIMTPGAADPSATLQVICRHNTKSRRRVRPETRAKVLADYNIALVDQYHYELDHLVPLAIGGANTAANLWPQPQDEADLKDVLENRIQDQVCSGAVPLVQAQHEIAEDWVAAYVKYVGKTIVLGSRR